MDEGQNYKSPLVYQRADPFALHANGKYYFTGSVPQYDCIELRCAESLDKKSFCVAARGSDSRSNAGSTAAAYDYIIQFVIAAH